MHIINIDSLVSEMEKIKSNNKEIELIQKDNNDHKIIGIRFNGKDKDILQLYFKKQGIISLSVGIRKIIYDFMQNNGLI